MVQGGDCLPFALEALAETLVASLDRNEPFEPRVLGFPHRAHSTRTDQLDDGVGSELRAALQRAAVEVRLFHGTRS